jgi:hypothetical protein
MDLELEEDFTEALKKVKRTMNNLKKSLIPPG